MFYNCCSATLINYTSFPKSLRCSERLVFKGFQNRPVQSQKIFRKPQILILKGSKSPTVDNFSRFLYMVSCGLRRHPFIWLVVGSSGVRKFFCGSTSSFQKNRTNQPVFSLKLFNVSGTMMQQQIKKNIGFPMNIKYRVPTPTLIYIIPNIIFIISLFYRTKHKIQLYVNKAKVCSSNSTL